MIRFEIMISRHSELTNILRKRIGYAKIILPELRANSSTIMKQTLQSSMISNISRSFSVNPPQRCMVMIPVVCSMNSIFRTMIIVAFSGRQATIIIDNVSDMISMKINKSVVENLIRRVMQNKLVVSVIPIKDVVFSDKDLSRYFDIPLESEIPLTIISIRVLCKALSIRIFKMMSAKSYSKYEQIIMSMDVLLRSIYSSSMVSRSPYLNQGIPYCKRVSIFSDIKLLQNSSEKVNIIGHFEINGKRVSRRRIMRNNGNGMKLALYICIQCFSEEIKQSLYYNVVSAEIMSDVNDMRSKIDIDDEISYKLCKYSINENINRRMFMSDSVYRINCKSMLYKFLDLVKSINFGR